MQHLIIPAIVAVACGAAGMALAGDDFFDSNGVKIRYVTEGEGEPVVLIHGWMADSSMWGRDSAGNTKLKASTPGFRVIALDCRGHGKSDKPHDVLEYGPKMGEDVVGLLEHLKIEKAHLVGYSSGSYLAGYVAAKYPERVLSVVYAGQAPLLKAEEKVGAGDASGTRGSTGGDGAKPGEAGKGGESAQPAEAKRGEVPQSSDEKKTGDPAQTDAPPKADETSEVEIFARAVDEGRDLGVYIIAVTPAGRPKPSEENAKTIANYMFKGKDVKALAAAGRGFKNLGVRVEDLKKCEAPTLFIHGGNEGEAVKSHVAAVRERLGRGEVKIIEGGDHMTTLMKPEFGKAIEEFLLRAKGK